MSFFKMLLTFAPWIAFLVIANGSMFRLKMGIIVAIVLTVIMIITKLHRGVIKWVGVLFFSYAFVAVVLRDSMWAVKYMGVLANGALAVGTWVGIVLKKPFTLEYAREYTDPSLWSSPSFLRTSYLLAMIWAVVFSINTVLAWQKSVHPTLHSWGYEAISYTLLVAAMFVSTWYPKYVRRKRESASPGQI